MEESEIEREMLVGKFEINSEVGQQWIGFLGGFGDG